MKYQLVFAFTVLLLKEFVQNQLVGDECIRQYDNAKGLCYQDYDCPQTKEEYHKKGIPLTHCAYLDGELIICCPEKLKKRLSAQKCEEYRELTTKKVFVWGLLLSHQSNASSGIDIELCDTSTPLIVGGVPTKSGEFPHMAAIGWKKTNDLSFECGGSLISELYVLTAAHCEKSDGIRPSFVRLGDQNLKTKNDGANDVDINISEFIKHPRYSYKTSKNDIALIKLQHNVNFSKYIRPACLWESNYFNFTKAIATGWGALQYGTMTSDELMKVELDIINNDDCNDLLSYSLSLSKDKFLDDTQLCSGVLAGGNDTCQGDSGGPLQVSFRENVCLHHIIGITSYGSALCGSPKTPAAYTRVSAYLDWIEDIVWN